MIGAIYGSSESDSSLKVPALDIAAEPMYGAGGVQGFVVISVEARWLNQN